MKLSFFWRFQIHNYGKFLRVRHFNPQNDIILQLSKKLCKISRCVRMFHKSIKIRMIREKLVGILN